MRVGEHSCHPVDCAVSLARVQSLPQAAGESKSPGYRRGRSESCCAIQSEVTSRLGFVADASVFPWIACIFRAIDGSDAEGGLALFLGEIVVATQFFSDQFEETVIRGKGKIGGLYGCRVSLAAGPARDDERDVSFTTGRDEIGLGRHVVDRVDDAVEFCSKEVFCVSLGEKCCGFVDDKFGIDQAHSLRDGSDFEFPDIAIESG